MHMYPRGFIIGVENVCVCVWGGVLLDVFFCLRIDECITWGTVL